MDSQDTSHTAQPASGGEAGGDLRAKRARRRQHRTTTIARRLADADREERSHRTVVLGSVLALLVALLGFVLWRRQGGEVSSHTPPLSQSPGFYTSRQGGASALGAQPAPDGTVLRGSVLSIAADAVVLNVGHRSGLTPGLRLNCTDGDGRVVATLEVESVSELTSRARLLSGTPQVGHAISTQVP